MKSNKQLNYVDGGRIVDASFPVSPCTREILSVITHSNCTSKAAEETLGRDEGLAPVILTIIW